MRDAFYKGEVGDSLVAGMKRGGGIITKEDLARYKPEWRKPIASTYRGYTLMTMPPSSSGGVTITETLNILETYDKLPPFGSAAYAHVLALGLPARVHRSQLEARRPGVRAGAGGQAHEQGVRARAAQDDRGRHAPRRRRSSSATITRRHAHHALLGGRCRGNAVATTTTINNGYGSGV